MDTNREESYKLVFDLQPSGWTIEVEENLKHLPPSILLESLRDILFYETTRYNEYLQKMQEAARKN